MTPQTLKQATIGITLGDPTGVGPEVMRAAVDHVLAAGGADLQVRLFLAAPLIAAYGRDWPAAVDVESVALLPDRLALAEPLSVGAESVDGPIELGVPSRFASRCALAGLAAMVTAAAERTVHSIVTGPVAKGIFDGFSPQPPGQTEYVAGRLGVDGFAMMLAGPKLRVVPVTTHVPLRDVATALTTAGIIRATTAAALDLRRWLNIGAPRIAVCGLNPHAGEGGRLGDEEARIIAPAVAHLRAAGLDVTGPLPADGLFFQALQGRWDLVVCMFHDQALGPLKTVHFFDGWNQTCGLPVPRLSPDHGTAWDIAGRGVADDRSATAAVALAARIAWSQS